jgi:hypothetical protein
MECGRDVLHLGIVRTPGEQVREGDVDVQALGDGVKELGDGRGRGGRCVVLHILAVDREGLAVVVELGIDVGLVLSHRAS